MRHPRLFCPDLHEGAVALSPEESRHAVASLRLSVGSQVVLFDGSGTQAAGVIVQLDRRIVTVEVGAIEKHAFELGCKLTLAVAMSRAHRQGYLVEKCTELGVAMIWPIIADRSTSRPQDAAVTKWSRRAIEAAKQSGRVWVPVIAAPMALADCLKKVREFDAVFIADLDPAAVSFTNLLETNRRAGSMLVLVGPEGGWSSAERRAAAEAGAVVCRLGPTVLRTETAAVAVCALVGAFFDADRASPEPWQADAEVPDGT